ncbi:hypothetical protein Tco_0748271 [Tanacetum coccineum]|uniref:Integrase, catalytic region, zinc finger, CCHC-type, peptidase aspartic, catalytic n=1 Tax=Tanacetum coccineum TaxID=301880 RepID=A0ABQ4YXS1_9ASTR
MSRMQEDIQCAGSDTRPPMLDRTDFESWQQRIRLYCLGKDNGENIMKSIKEGPFQMGTVSDVITGGTEGAVQQGPVRARVLNDLSAEEKERYKADIRATNILLQGIPKDIYSLINHYTDAKDIWENVKMILEGSELTKDDRESQLYDEFEHFRQIKGEGIQGYYVRFTKLINDMRNIKMTMSRMQLNSKFVNNMLPEWSRFITEVKLNRGLKESNSDQLYAYLKQHEVHANENRIMMERFGQPNTDPLALVSDASAQQCSNIDVCRTFLKLCIVEDPIWDTISCKLEEPSRDIHVDEFVCCQVQHMTKENIYSLRKEMREVHASINKDPKVLTMVVEDIG